MSIASVAPGDAAAISRSLGGDPDPLALYAALSEEGTRPGTILFEQPDGHSFILEAAALKAECRGATVTLAAQSANGRNLIQLVAARMASSVVSRDRDRVLLGFPPIESEDAGNRLTAPSPFDVLRELTTGLSQASRHEPHGVMALGAIAYDHVDFFEQLPPAANDPLDFPDFIFWVAESLIVFEANRAPRAVVTAFGSGDGQGLAEAQNDAIQRLGRLVERCGKVRPIGPGPAAPKEPGKLVADLDDDAYAGLVDRMKSHIAAGDVYQIVASRSFALPCPAPLHAYAALRRLDRSPYCFFLAGEQHILFGASPETSVRIRPGDAPTVEVKPIAGTRGRGSTRDEDDRLEAELRLDPKEQAEHMMLVDLARNDVARISQPGTRQVTRLMDIERYAKVMHLVSTVSGKLKAGFDFTHALKACLNMGTLTGAPKIRATQLLRQAEASKRGPYGGTIGWVSGSGAMDSAIIIRSAVVRDEIAHVRAGAGIVHDSLPEAEADETRRKASALLSVLAGAAA